MLNHIFFVLTGRIVCFPPCVRITLIDCGIEPSLHSWHTFLFNIPFFPFSLV